MNGVLNHLWQSSLFALAGALFTLLLRRNSARTRYWLWFAASVKFLIPFSILVDAGSRIEWRTAPAIVQPAVTIPLNQVFMAPSLVLPTPESPRPKSNYWPEILGAAWLSGSLIVLFSWARQWRKINAAVRAARPVELGLSIRTMSSPVLLEPGVFGVFRPVLLLPEGIADRLAHDQMEAVVEHELCHVRNHDNLTAAIHMLTEAVFWFHPLLWWIGKRLIAERERACDEEVLRLGSDRQAYAESILKVCEFYLESPLNCVSGITGSDLRRRVRHIMTNQGSRRLNAGRRLLLAFAAVAAAMGPIAIGALNAPFLRAQSQGGLAFEVASVKFVKPGSQPENRKIAASHGSLTIQQQTLRECILWAYNLPSANPISGPAWLDSEQYDIAAKAEESATQSQLRLMLQALLADRFNLKIRHTTEQRPFYSLVIGKGGGKGGPKLHEVQREPVRGFHVDQDGSVLSYHMVTNMSRLAEVLPGFLDRPLFDKTGLTGVYDFTLRVEMDHPIQFPEVGRPFEGFGLTPGIFPAVEGLGLKLISEKGPVDVLVIDHAERPSGNDQAYFRKVMWAPQTFEVASIRPSNPNGGGDTKMKFPKPGGAQFQIEHHRVTLPNFNLFALIVHAYGLRGCRPWGGADCVMLSGGPDWIRKDTYDVVAKMPDNSPDYSLTLGQFQSGRGPQVQVMLQALLADRFRLKLHREERTVPVFALTIGKKGSKLKKADESEEPLVAFKPSVQANGQQMIHLMVKNSTIQDVVDLFAKFMDRPVLDQTGLKDRYDFTLNYEANADAPGPFTAVMGPDMFKAFEEQAGLKMESTKGSVEVLVIDHAEKPSAN